MQNWRRFSASRGLYLPPIKAQQRSGVISVLEWFSQAFGGDVFVCQVASEAAVGGDRKNLCEAHTAGRQHLSSGATRGR